jgi:hypothetical protein
MATTTTQPTGVKLAPAGIISPPPADITIAQAARPLPIGEVAEMMGLAEGEYDHLGAHQAKVRVCGGDEGDACVPLGVRCEPVCVPAGARQGRNRSTDLPQRAHYSLTPDPTLSTGAHVWGQPAGHRL